MTTAVPFSKVSPAPLVFDKASKRCVGWGAFSKKGYVEYDDAHGDHTPDDEFFKAVGGLMKKDYADREINVEHVGAAQGSIVTAWALGEDVAKALKIDTGGNYGVLLDFEPGAELLAKMEAGELFCLSMEGLARNVQIVKSADGDIAATKRKRILRGVELTKWAVVKAGAHDGAEVALIKAATPSAAALIAARARIAKATPALTSPAAAHQHQIADIDEASGCTSAEQMCGCPNCDAMCAVGGQMTCCPACGTSFCCPDGGWHSHLWVKAADGSVVVAMALGHTHTAPYTDSPPGDAPMADAPVTATAADLAKSQARCSTLASLLPVAASMPPDMAAFAKGLPAEKLEGFLALPEAERAKMATPVYKCVTTGATYFASSPESEVSLAKALDAQAVELAKSREAGEAVAFEKRARDEMGNVVGETAAHVAILKAIDGKPLTEAERTAAKGVIAKVNIAYGSVFKSVGVGDAIEADPASPMAAFNKAHAEFAKAKGKQPYEVAAEFASTPDGQRLYAAAYPLDRPRA